MYKVVKKKYLEGLKRSEQNLEYNLNRAESKLSKANNTVLVLKEQLYKLQEPNKVIPLETPYIIPERVISIKAQVYDGQTMYSVFDDNRVYLKAGDVNVANDYLKRIKQEQKETK